MKMSNVPYTVSSYTPGRHIRFEFGGGRQGYHEFTLQEIDDMTCFLRHATKAKLTFNSAWRWYFLIRPLHNALIEDLFDKVESQVARVEHPQIWSHERTIASPAARVGALLDTLGIRETNESEPFEDAS